MLKYKINIADALERKGFNSYKAKTTKLLSQDTLRKLKNEDTSISLESINRICIILDMQPKDLIEYVENEEEKKKYFFWNISNLYLLKVINMWYYIIVKRNTSWQDPERERGEQMDMDKSEIKEVIEWCDEKGHSEHEILELIRRIVNAKPREEKETE